MSKEIAELNALRDQLILYFVQNGMSIAVGLVISALGFWVGKSIAGLVLKVCEKRNIDITLSRFFAGATKLIITAFAIVIGLSQAGFAITPLVALLGAGAFGLSLAVQGPISNYGAGVVLIITRPFVVGDTLSVSGQSGLVDRVNLGSTELVNEDEERITIPNRMVLSQIFTNSNEFRIVEGVVGIEYSADPEQAIACISEAVRQVRGVADERAADIGIDAFADSSINIGYRVWVQTSQFHKTRYALNLSVYHALKEANLAIPFPQRDVHIIAESDTSL